MSGASNFPGALDSDANLGRVLNTDVLVPAHHNNLTDAIESIEGALGTEPAMGWPVAGATGASIYENVVAAAAGGGGGSSGSGGFPFAVVASSAAVTFGWPPVDHFMDTVVEDASGWFTGSGGTSGLLLPAGGYVAMLGGPSMPEDTDNYYTYFQLVNGAGPFATIWFHGDKNVAINAFGGCFFVLSAETAMWSHGLVYFGNPSKVLPAGSWLALVKLY